MAMDILPVRSKNDLDAFIHLPWSVYRNFPCWVPPLLTEIKETFDPRKNPFLAHSETQLFLAKQRGQVVGRVAAIDNSQYRNYHNDPVGFFGFFESRPDPAIAKELLGAACDWLKQRGLEHVRGPVGLAPALEDMGILYKGFDEPPAFMMPYNPEYYAELLEGVGFKKIKDSYAYQVNEMEMSGKIHNLIQWLGALKTKEGATIRKINLKNYDSEIRLIRNIYDSIFENLWGFAPISDREFQHLAGRLRQILDPDLAFIALVEQKPVGFLIAVPDVNQVLRKLNGRLHPIAFLRLMWGLRRIDGMRLLAGGVVPSHRDAGLAALLLHNLTQSARKKGYKNAEISWVLEDNTALNYILGKAGVRIRKVYRLYDLLLSP